MLFPDPEPPRVPGIDLRCCDVRDMLAEAEGATLIVADPPWVYRSGTGLDGVAEDQYDVLGLPEIAAHLQESAAACAESARLLLWCTWPFIFPVARLDLSPWRFVSGGSWHKTGQLGVGYHHRGDSEPVLLYVKGAPGRPPGTVSNAHGSPNPGHSEKPLAWAREQVRAWTAPGDLVVDLYAGMAPYARACHLEGRRYLGAEIDPERHRRALGLLAGCRG